MDVTELIFSYNHITLNIMPFSKSYLVAMITYLVEKITITCLQMLRHLFYNSIIVSTGKKG